MDWLDTNSPENTTSPINYAVRRTRQVHSKKMQRNSVIESEIFLRLQARGRNKDEAERRKVEKTVSKLIAGQVTTEQVGEVASVPACEDSAFVVKMMNNPAAAINDRFLHTWFDSTSGCDKVYQGHIRKLKKKKLCTYVVEYHDVNVSEGESEDFDMTRNQIVTDLMCGDLVIN